MSVYGYEYHRKKNIKPIQFIRLRNGFERNWKPPPPTTTANMISDRETTFVSHFFRPFCWRYLNSTKRENESIIILSTDHIDSTLLKHYFYCRIVLCGIKSKDRGILSLFCLHSSRLNICIKILRHTHHGVRSIQLHTQANSYSRPKMKLNRLTMPHVCEI